MTQNNKHEGRSFLHKLLIAVFLVIVISALIGGVIFVYNNNIASTQEVFKFEGIFVDINGDGLQDYVRYAEVVINKGDFTISP
jgi:hypothetical protein